MKPFYEDAAAGITLYHADCRDVLPRLTAGCADSVITDPPYAEETHVGARGARPDVGPVPLIDFAAFDAGALSRAFGLCGPLIRRWLIASVDWHHMLTLEQAPPDGLRFVRFGVWCKPNGAPQFTGDRPATGWEAIAILHRAGGKMRWNGGGRNAVFNRHKVNTAHPTGKPLSLVKELLTLFTDPGETVLDPFAGSFTTARACKDLGRRFIGIELEERWCEFGARRLSQEVLALEPTP